MLIYVYTQAYTHTVYVFFIHTCINKTHTLYYIYTHITINPTSMNIKYSLKRISVLFIYIICTYEKSRNFASRLYGLQRSLLSKLDSQ